MRKLLIAPLLACAALACSPTKSSSSPENAQTRSESSGPCSDPVDSPPGKPGNLTPGCVVSVIDGDTLIILDQSNVQHKIRLAGIDAPEHNQDFGQNSKQNLARLVFHKNVWCSWKKMDRYGRTVGVIYLNGQDMNLQQVEDGLAWHYKEYEKEQGPEDRSAYAVAEDKARSARVQLWSMPDPVPPWDFRRRKRGGVEN